MLASRHAGRVNNDDYDTCPNGFSQRYMQHLGDAMGEDVNNL